jgi:hypothetical protein
MSRLAVLVLAGVAAVSVGARAGGVPSAQLVVQPAVPHALDPVRIELRTDSGRSISDLRVRARSPVGRTLRVRTTPVRAGVRAGTFRFLTPGTWRLLVTDPAGRRIAGTRPRAVRVLVPRLTPPPEGFGALGRPGCNPPSPADGSAQGLRDVFGTAVGREQLWALPFVPEGAAWPTPHFAVFDGLVGKEIKIVFGMTTFHTPFRASGPGSTILQPVWGPSFHAGSSWDRQPGTEWGAGFVFPSAGCWRIQVGSRGSLYFLIRS